MKYGSSSIELEFKIISVPYYLKELEMPTDNLALDSLNDLCVPESVVVEKSTLSCDRTARILLLSVSSH